jgi:hypothetical protein
VIESSVEGEFLRIVLSLTVFLTRVFKNITVKTVPTKNPKINKEKPFDWFIALASLSCYFNTISSNLL